MNETIKTIVIAFLGGAMALGGYSLLPQEKQIISLEKEQTITFTQPVSIAADRQENTLDFKLAANNSLNSVVHINTETKMRKLSEEERLAWQRYKIKRGDNLGGIAQKFNTSIALIKQVNNVGGTQIRAGKHLLIPVAARSLDSYILSKNQRLAKKQGSQRSGIKTTHIVQSGDTLWDLSQYYKVGTRSIAKWNGMAPKDYIKPGQKLVIWQKKAHVKSSGVTIENAIMRNITYKVRRGDSLARIADKFNISIKDIERWNSINRNKYLQPGQFLKLSVDVTNNI